jgi:hypothetical protein
MILDDFNKMSQFDQDILRRHFDLYELNKYENVYGEYIVNKIN